MTPDIFNVKLTGRIALIIAILALVSVITLILLYSGFPFFGPVNDITNAIIGIMSALLVWQFHALKRDGQPILASIIMYLAFLGAAAITVNSVLVAFGMMHWMVGGMYTGLGYGFLGIWLLGISYLEKGSIYFSAGVNRLSKIAAIAMLFGLLAGPLLVFGAGLLQTPLVWVMYLGAAAGWILYPVWCWRIGLKFISM